MIDEYDHFNQPTALEQADESSKAEWDTEYLAHSSIRRASRASGSVQNTSITEVKCVNCNQIEHFARDYRTAVPDCHRR